jgi:glucose/mannose-6-phosphate isomerase
MAEMEMDSVLDSMSMWDASLELPEQIERAAESAIALGGLPVRQDIENIVVLGMGGSGISGDVLLAIAGPFLAVPVAVIKSYTMPAFVGPGTLLFAASFSGNTEETLEAIQIAVEQGAQVVVVTSGGELELFAEQHHLPVIRVESSIPQPRAAFGAMSIPPLVVLEEVGLFPGATHWIDLAVAQLKRRRDQISRRGSESEVIAERIVETVPVMASSAALGSIAGFRWKAQINENVKSPAFNTVIPEACHNELTGWEERTDLTTASFSWVALRHDAEHPQISRRFEIVQEMLEPKLATFVTHRAEGEGDLAQLLDLVMVGDFVSLHLARLMKVDPGPIPVLVELKNRLRSGR